MTTITTGSTIGVVLTTPAYVNPVVIDPGVVITGSASGGDAIAAYSPGWTISNGGYLGGRGTAGTGIYLGAGGVVTNQAGGIIGNSPSSSGGGIYITGGAGTITNASTIKSGVWLQAGGTVTNQGSGRIISASTSGGYGVGFYSGGALSNAGWVSGLLVGVDGSHLGANVTNQTGATISGQYVGVLMAVVDQPTIGVRYLDNQAGGTIVGNSGFMVGASSGTVINAGFITGTFARTVGHDGITLVVGDGVNMAAGGFVSNQTGGRISGADYGVYITNGPATVVNAGTLTGGSGSNGGGIALGQLNGGSHGYTVTNLSGGMIYGPVGIHIVSNTGQPQTVMNQAGGTIAGVDAGVIVESSLATVVNSGVISATSKTVGDGAIFLPIGGVVINNSGALISGYTNAILPLAAITVTNAGTIDGGFELGSGRLIVDPGAVFAGSRPFSGGVAGSVLELAQGAGGAGTLSGLGTLITDFASLQFDPDAQWTVIGNDGSSGFGSISITGFAAGDTIELTGITATGSGYSGGVLTINEAAGSATLNLTGSFTPGQLVVTNVAGGAEVTVACFRAGTRIRTRHGEVAVERLRVGDEVVTGFSGTTAVTWIGHRTIDCAHHPRPERVWPVRIAAGTFANGLPRRDLFLSPDHAVFIDDVLIPVRHLVNGGAIAQVPADSVTYYHVELATHDLLFAEGLPAESYLDTGDRWHFASGGTPIQLFPAFGKWPPDVGPAWEARGCAALVVAGPVLEAVRRQIAARITARATAGRSLADKAKSA